MEKILFVATVDEHIRHFHYPFLEWFKNNGYEVHVASKGEEDLLFVDEKHNIPFEQFPFSFSNFKAYIQLNKLIKDNNYRLIHCHTPVGSVIARLASIRERRRGLKVLYTAHGFHFYKGAPKKNWILYYPVEKLLSNFTDTLILINEEDYNLALNKKFKAKRIEYVKGVGVNLSKFIPKTLKMKETLRDKYLYEESDLILIYVAELKYRKNQEFLINAVKILKDEIPELKLLLVGGGEFYSKYNCLIENMNLGKNIELLGYRRDIVELMLLSDICVSSAIQEGLPVNIMEAMATGLPLLVSNCRGNRSLVKDGENGYVFDINDIDAFRKYIIKLNSNRDLCKNFGERSIEMVTQYSLDNILPEMAEIYLDLLED